MGMGILTTLHKYEAYSRKPKTFVIFNPWRYKSKTLQNHLKHISFISGS